MLQKTQKGRDKTYTDSENGVPPSKKRKYAVNDAAILKIVQEYDERTTIEYLRAVANYLGAE